MSLEAVKKEIDANSHRFIERLRDAVAIPSVSADPERRSDVLHMIDWAAKHLEALGADCQQIPNGTQQLPDGTEIVLPPVLFAELGKDPKKKTLLVYGHLDVQPAEKSDGWNTDPFVLTEKDGKLYGRGSSDDKGPVLAWMNAIEALKKLNIDIPVNIKFCLEGMEENGSEGLEDILTREKDGYLKDVDFCCISDSQWLGKTKPCLTYGLRGICYYFVEIQGVSQDLHSGIFGGSVYEPMNDLLWVLSQLSAVDGKIHIPEIHQMVAPVKEGERELYESIDFDIDEYRKDLGAFDLTTMDKAELLMRRSPGAKTVIPAKVVGKFSIRIVPNMKPNEVDDAVVAHLNKLWSQRGSPNRFKAYPGHEGGKCWSADPADPNYQAGARAMKAVFGVEPDLVREGCSIPITITFQELTGKNVLLLPICASDDMAHSQNEKMNVRNYIEGTKVMAAYLMELGKL
ncbi:hypothetical protein QR680_003982 [Steinernema hermaphroditum]|uniref:Peptidase M20 dimerisation domain-containing protein n=1 Tax=Steinernema hermaphroditum TaxID=289476 RepID=A0AA39HNP4_9BILA|nr:hypothetical protein QR680_003982 [Steinernema hermaphroditum]